jgi:hypothetical protein
MALAKVKTFEALLDEQRRIILFWAAGNMTSISCQIPQGGPSAGGHWH